MPADIHQIYYDDKTANQIDRGFIALENRGNPRPDWREYWPIRNYFLENTLNEDDLYGFFSPNFFGKTHLYADQVYAFINNNPGQDVYIFSPFIQDAACYLNMFEHGNRYHPGMHELTDALLKSIGLEVNLHELPMDFRSTIFCNFIVAKPVFWKKWFAITEHLFNVVENGNNDFSAKLTALTTYHKMPLDMKVFIMERIASLILALDGELQVAAFDISQMPWSDIAYYSARSDMYILNALKLAYMATTEKRYLQLFYALRNDVLKRCDRLYGDENREHFFS